LTICSKLAELMGSRLRVETEAGRGTRFYFELELPACQSQRGGVATEDAQATSAA
jgi:signal transduction histidine kinase